MRLRPGGDGVELTGEELLRRLHITRAELQAWVDNGLLTELPGPGTGSRPPRSRRGS